MLVTYVFSETSPAAASTAPSSQTVENAASWAPKGVAAGQLDDADAIDIKAELVGATGGTLDVYVQSSTSEGDEDWFDVCHFAQLASGAAAVNYRVQLGLVGQPASAAPVAVGKNLSPALAAGTAVQAVAFDRGLIPYIPADRA